MTPDIPTWEDTFPHFSTHQTGSRITAQPIETDGILGFALVASFVSWAFGGVCASWFVKGVSDGTLAWWWAMLLLLYFFVPPIFTAMAADEARNTFGQKLTGTRVALIPMFAGAGLGLLLSACWTRNEFSSITTVLGLTGVACAAPTALLARAGVRRTRAQLAEIAALREHGTRSSGTLHDITFLKKWSGSDPQFQVRVKVTAGSRPRWITANMTTTHRRVPVAGSAAVVTWAPSDPTGQVLIELDPAVEPRFDPNHARYELPTGN
jgi:hypothetical protein